MTRGVQTEITDEMRRQVEIMAGFGLSDHQIAAVLGMPERTMNNNFADDLPRGRAKALAAVAKTCYQMAISGKVPAATFFYLKCRGRWRETDGETKPEGGPLVIGPPTETPALVAPPNPEATP